MGPASEAEFRAEWRKTFFFRLVKKNSRLSSKKTLHENKKCEKKYSCAKYSSCFFKHLPKNSFFFNVWLRSSPVKTNIIRRISHVFVHYFFLHQHFFPPNKKNCSDFLDADASSFFFFTGSYFFSTNFG